MRFPNPAVSSAVHAAARDLPLPGPVPGKDVYLVDTCPSCNFSTFGDETFSTCPKCGIVIKTYVERQREEQRLKHDQELLGKKLGNVEIAPPQPEAAAAPVADFIDNLHPANLISWGVAAAAIIILGIGIWGVIGYDSASIQALLMEESDEQIQANTHSGIMVCCMGSTHVRTVRAGSFDTVHETAENRAAWH